MQREPQNSNVSPYSFVTASLQAYCKLDPF